MFDKGLDLGKCKANLMELKVEVEQEADNKKREIIIALIDFVALYLLLKMKKTGWILVTLMEIITIILGVLVLSMTNILGIVLAFIIVIYLFTKRKLFV